MLTAEQREIRSLAREFAGSEIRPRAAEWDEARALDDGIFSQLAELGFLGMRVPESHGGLGLDPVTYLVAVEELSWGDPVVGLQVSVQNGLVATAILERGSGEQRERWLPALASGDLLGAFALSEPRAGSDATALETRAERADDGWVLTGRKKWVTNGDRADRIIVFARTGEGRKAVGAFVVDRSADGYRVVARETTMGFRASETVEVELDGVRVPGEDVLGDPQGGFACAMDALDAGRLGVAAVSLGIAQAALEHSISYATEREQFDRPIADFGAIREKLARMEIRIAQARALAHRVAEEYGEGAGAGNPGDGPGLRSLTARVGMAKTAASEAALWVADEAVQIYGGYGYMRDYPVEKLMRDAKGTEIFEGTNEILRELTARALLEEISGG